MIKSLTVISLMVTDFVTIETVVSRSKGSDLVIRLSCNPTAISFEQIGSNYQDSTVYVIQYFSMLGSNS